MLKRITIDNFTTFINPTTIDFSATNYKFLEDENVGSNRILKGALFVGENASGKTQILKAITFILNLLVSNRETSFVGYRSFYTEKKTFNIEYEFVIDSKSIIYELELSDEKIIKEKLSMDSKTIIDRLGNTAKFMYNEQKTFEDLSDQLPFIRRIYFDTHFYDDKALNKWFDFLKNSVYINCYDKHVLEYGDNRLHLKDYLEDKGTDDINAFFKKINYNQEIAYSNKTPNNLGDVSIRRKDDSKFVSFKKGGTNIYIPMILESTGNHTLVELLPSFLHAIEKNCMIILDEFSSGFHNELEEALLKYFYHYSKDCQIFFCVTFN